VVFFKITTLRPIFYALLSRISRRPSSSCTSPSLVPDDGDDDSLSPVGRRRCSGTCHLSIQAIKRAFSFFFSVPNGFRLIFYSPAPFYSGLTALLAGPPSRKSLVELLYAESLYKKVLWRTGKNFLLFSHKLLVSSSASGLTFFNPPLTPSDLDFFRGLVLFKPALERLGLLNLF